MKMAKILSIFGTRPEAIKMAPLALQLNKNCKFEHKVCVTGQHRQMLDQILDFFTIEPDYDLDLMQANQKIDELVSKIITGVGDVLRNFEPDLVLVHGDTATTLGAAISCYYNKIKFAHVEAGLRTHDIRAPWPEEGNRSLVARLSDLHFAPTDDAVANLINEGIDAAIIYNVGNTVVDAVKLAEHRIYSDANLLSKLHKKFPFSQKTRKSILVTSHRRENFGGGIEKICEAILKLSKNPDLQIIFPVHLNPNILGPVSKTLGGIENVELIPPQSYEDFVYLMSRSDLILTDSGGIQEEAPSLGKPVLLMRENTERPEAIRAGTVMMVGSNPDKIAEYAKEILIRPSFQERFSMISNPYGDGHTAEKIIEILENEMETK